MLIYSATAVFCIVAGRLCGCPVPDATSISQGGQSLGMVCGVSGNACRQHIQGHTNTIPSNNCGGGDGGWLWMSRFPVLCLRVRLARWRRSALALPCYGNHTMPPTSPPCRSAQAYPHRTDRQCPLQHLRLPLPLPLCFTHAETVSPPWPRLDPISHSDRRQQPQAMHTMRPLPPIL